MKELFKTHGVYCVSNAGGYRIMLSDCGEYAKVQDAFGSDNPKTSDWMEIEEVYDRDEDCFVHKIDPNGYNIPMTKVIAFENWFTVSDLGDYVNP